MSSLKMSIGIGLMLVLAVGAAWMAFGPSDQLAPAPAPGARSPARSVAQPPDGVEQPTKAIEPPALADDHPIDPQSTAANDEPGDAIPVDLTAHYRMKASDFDKVTQFPWPAVPRGSQTFADVPLEIGGAMFLWGERNAKNGLVFPEQIIGIPVSRKFETLYVCHGLFFEGTAGTPVYEAVFHYDDGTTISDAIVCGEDVHDWFARQGAPLGPSGDRSTLAWNGDGKYGDRDQAIRFCLTAITNPHPDKEATAIDFVSLKTQSAACILAVTTGKSGLMQRAEETPPEEARDE